MDKKTAEDIYWTLASKINFTLNCTNDKDYERIKNERVKIAGRYLELKRELTYSQAYTQACVEWLMGNESAD